MTIFLSSFVVWILSGVKIIFHNFNLIFDLFDVIFVFFLFSAVSVICLRCITALAISFCQHVFLNNLISSV